MIIIYRDTAAALFAEGNDSRLFSAFTMLAIYGAKDEAQVRSAMFWLMGSLTGIQWSMVPVGGAMLFLTMLFIWLMRHELDLILLGRNEARHLGMPVQRVQQMIVLISSLAVAVVVALSGIIGFVGLVVPHMVVYCSGGCAGDGLGRCGSSHLVPPGRTAHWHSDSFFGSAGVHVDHQQEVQGLLIC